MHTAVLEFADPAAWPSHRFGLSAERWASLAGQVFLITGGGTGFGQALAIALAATGASVVVTGRRLAKLEETVALASRFGVDPQGLVPVPADLCARSEINALMERIDERFGTLHGVVNNAALPTPASGKTPLSTLDAAGWNRHMATNLTAPWQLLQAALPLLQRAGRFRALFVTSEAGWADTPGHGPYNVGKAALNTLARSFAAELAAAFPTLDTQVNTLIPGEALTEMNRGSTNSPFTMASMALALLSHPPGGPNGAFFHRDGRHFGFAYAKPYPHSLL